MKETTWLLVAVFLLLLSTTFCGIGSLENYFDHIDVNKDNLLSAQDLSEVVCKRESGKCDYHPKQVNYVMSRLDKDRSGFISKNEFLEAISKEYSPIEGGPQQIHLALTTDPTEMVVIWISRDHDVPSTVTFGQQSGVYPDNTTGTIYTYDAGEDGWSGWIHQVTLTGLKSASKYYYRVGIPGSWSDEFSFVTAPEPSDSSFTSHVFGVVADQGTYIPMGWAVIDQMVAAHKEDPFSMILHAGDICYAGTGSDWEFEEVWDVWEDLAQPLAANIPYMFAVGNHEHYYNWAAFTNRFLMPGKQSDGNGNFWYSINYGNVHFLFFSTEHPFAPGSVQYTWMEADLTKAEANRKLVPWVILVAHRPMYCSDSDEWDDHRPGGRIQSQLEPLFLKYKVDLYLCGHQHVYERIHPNINGTLVATGNVYVNPKAPAHVDQATAGVFVDSTWIDPQPIWSASRQSEWGYGKMTINQTHLLYQFFSESTYEVADYFWIIKN